MAVLTHPDGGPPLLEILDPPVDGETGRAGHGDSLRPPARQDAGPDSEAGRGLMLVAGLVSQWDSGRADGGGKVTWAVV
jgi:hypothetical protein